MDNKIPQIVKLQSSDVLYANKALLDFIKEKCSQPSAELKPNDNIYFFKDVTFKRSLLDISADKYIRVILLAKANAVVINTNITLPDNGIGYANKQISPNLPAWEAEDVLFNISSLGEAMVTVFDQWLNLSRLTHQPRLIGESDILKYINSGVVLDDDTYETTLELIKSDPQIAVKFIDSCDVVKSRPYLMYLLHFEKGWNVKHLDIWYGLKNAKNYLDSLHCYSSFNLSFLPELLAVPTIKNKMTATISKKLKESLVKEVPSHMTDLIENLTVDFKWK